MARHLNLELDENLGEKLTEIAKRNGRTLKSHSLIVLREHAEAEEKRRQKAEAANG